MKEARFVYLHGFASSSKAYKGQALREAFHDLGITLEVPDLNVPSFSGMTYSSILGFLDSLLQGIDQPLYMIGSSMGGYLAARWAQKNPSRIRALVLLCPAFDLAGRWARNQGNELMQRWQEEGELLVPDASGLLQPLRWEFIEDARRHPTHPHSNVPTLIIHGTEDIIVPVSSSRDYARTHPSITLHEVADDHGLAASVDVIWHRVRQFFGLHSVNPS